MSPQLIRVESTVNPLTGRHVCVAHLNGRLSEITPLIPERDPAVTTLPDQPDPAVPGYGYTGRLTTVGPVILLAADQRQQIEGWQRDHAGQPWPLYGMRSHIDRDTLSIQATNGTWTWRLHPAYWPEMGDTAHGEFGWYVGTPR